TTIYRCENDSCCKSKIFVGPRYWVLKQACSFYCVLACDIEKFSTICFLTTAEYVVIKLKKRGIFLEPLSLSKSRSCNVCSNIERSRCSGPARKQLVKESFCEES